MKVIYTPRDNGNETQGLHDVWSIAEVRFSGDYLFSVRGSHFCWCIILEHQSLSGSWMISKRRASAVSPDSTVVRQTQQITSGKKEKVMAPFKKSTIRKVIFKGKLTLMFMWIIIVIHFNTNH